MTSDHGRPSNVLSAIANQTSSQLHWGSFISQLIFETLFTTIEIQKRRQRWSILSLLKMSDCQRLSLGWCVLANWVKMRWRAWCREPCRLESTPLIWRIFMAMASVSSSLVRSSNVVRIFGTRCGSSPSVGFAKMALPILIFQRTIFWIPSMASSSVCRSSA